MWIKRSEFFRIHDRLDGVDKDLYELSLKFQKLIDEYDTLIEKQKVMLEYLGIEIYEQQATLKIKKTGGSR